MKEITCCELYMNIFLHRLPIKSKGKLPLVWLKFKLLICDLKFDILPIWNVTEI